MWTYDTQNPLCYKYFDGLFETNGLNALKGFRATLDQMIRDWQSARGSWESVEGLFEQKRFLVVPANLVNLLDTWFYWATVPTTNLMVSNLSENSEFISQSSYYVYSFLVVIFVFCLYFIANRVRIITVWCHGPIYIIPLELIEKNAEAVSYFQKVMRGKNVF